jgi:hypothetical protein
LLSLKGYVSSIAAGRGSFANCYQHVFIFQSFSYTMTGIAGFDIRDYPSDDIMQWLHDQTNLHWTGFYLTPAPCQGVNRGWMYKYELLKNMGWGFAPLFLGQQAPGTSPCNSHILTEQQGTIDGQRALDLMRWAGFPANSLVYLDIEAGPPLGLNFLAYISAWVNEIYSSGEYRPGIYCSYRNADQIGTVTSGIVYWVWRLHIFNCPFASTVFYPEPDPSSSGVNYASAWQIIQECKIDVGDGRTLKVDLDTAIAEDPSSI